MYNFVNDEAIQDAFKVTTSIRCNFVSINLNKKTVVWEMIKILSDKWCLGN